MKPLDSNTLYAALMELPDSAKEHMKYVIRMISMCYLDECPHTFGIVAVWEDDMLHVMPIGANEKQVLDLLQRSRDTIETAMASTAKSDGAHIH